VDTLMVGLVSTGANHRRNFERTNQTTSVPPSQQTGLIDFKQKPIEAQSRNATGQGGLVSIVLRFDVPTWQLGHNLQNLIHR